MARILITGISGSLAALCAERLVEEGHEVAGIDYRPRRAGLSRRINFVQGNYNKRIIEDVFRRFPPDSVLHLGRVGNLKTNHNKRFDLNVVGSAKVQELCVKYEVKRLVVLSTFHIYGAHPANHIPIFEDEPLRAGTVFPQLSDAVQLDGMASHWVYRYPQLLTVVLRPSNIIGPHIRNAVSSYLRRDVIPYLLGFSPMWQFIHEDDMVDALMCALGHTATGIFNVAGPGAVPLQEALAYTGKRLLPLPATFAEAALRITGRATIPPYILDFLKYPCVISDDAFRKAFDFEPQRDPREAVESTILGV